MHDLSHGTRLREREDVDGARLQPLHEMPFPTDHWHTNSDRRFRSYLAYPPRPLLDKRLPRCCSWLTGKFLFAILTIRHCDEINRLFPWNQSGNAGVSPARRVACWELRNRERFALQ